MPADLHIFTNDCEFICATDAADAAKAYAEFCGSPCDTEALDQIADDKPIGFWCDADGNVAEYTKGELVKLLAREWAARHGRGYMGSTEY